MLLMNKIPTVSTDLQVNDLENAGDPAYSYILSGIALFVLLIACISFVNLAVARYKLCYCFSIAALISFRSLIRAFCNMPLKNTIGMDFIFATIPWAFES